MGLRKNALNCLLRIQKHHSHTRVQNNRVNNSVVSCFFLLNVKGHCFIQMKVAHHFPQVSSHVWSCIPKLLLFSMMMKLLWDYIGQPYQQSVHDYHWLIIVFFIFYTGISSFNSF